MLDLGIHVAGFHPPQHGRFQPAETEIRGVPFHLREREPDCAGISERSQFVDHRATGIAEAEQLGHFVEGLPRRIVARFAEKAVVEPFEYLKQMCMAAADHQRECGKFHRFAALARFHHHRVNMALDMIHPDQRQAARKAQRFREGDADQERPDEPWALCHSDGA